MPLVSSSSQSEIASLSLLLSSIPETDHVGRAYQIQRSDRQLAMEADIGERHGSEVRLLLFLVPVFTTVRT
jgi:hypothetical protein